jgi:hypothetical protein
MARTYSTHGGKAGRKETTRRHIRCCEDIKTDLREIGWNGMDLIDVAQDGDQWMALVNTVINLHKLKR